jgi:hypothetical protein
MVLKIVPPKIKITEIIISQFLRFLSTSFSDTAEVLLLLVIGKYDFAAGYIPIQ